MKRLVTLVALLVLWPSLSAADSQLAAVKQKLAQRLPAVSVEGLRASKSVPGWYELEHGMQLLFISADARHLFLGDLIDLEAQKNLSEAWREQHARARIEAVGEENMIVMGPKNAKRTITVFTDVDCPYCAKLHREVPELTKNGVKVRYLLFPRTGTQSETYRKSVAVWCSEDRIKAIGHVKAGGRIESKTCANPVEQHYQLGLELQVRGTPTIFLDNGKVLGGYVPSERLLGLLELSASARTSNAR